MHALFTTSKMKSTTRSWDSEAVSGQIQQYIMEN